MVLVGFGMDHMGVVGWEYPLLILIEDYYFGFYDTQAS